MVGWVGWGRHSTDGGYGGLAGFRRLLRGSRQFNVTLGKHFKTWWVDITRVGIFNPGFTAGGWCVLVAAAGCFDIAAQAPADIPLPNARDSLAPADSLTGQSDSLQHECARG